MIQIKSSPSFFHLVNLHYNYIAIMDRQHEDRYKFKPISITKNEENWEYKFEIEDALEIEPNNEFCKN